MGAVESASVRQDVFRTTAELGDPGGQSAWWTWTAPRDGWWEIEALADEGLGPFPPLPTSRLQVFVGDQLERLRVAPDGGLATPRPNSRQLFRATAGQVFQIAATSGYSGRFHDAVFTLRPVQLGKNVTPMKAAALQRQREGHDVWAGSSWANRGKESISVTENRTLYSPLYWRWTAPYGGTFEARSDSSRSFDYLITSVYQVSDEGKLELVVVNQIAGTPVSFTAAGGDEFLIVTATLYRRTAVGFHACQVTGRGTSGGRPPTPSIPFNLKGPLPVTADQGSLRSSRIWWRWSSPIDGWIEFDGPAELVPTFDQVAGQPRVATPRVLSFGGKRLFWVTVGTYRFTVRGWDLDPSSAQTFTLRDAGLVPPGHDDVSAARDLGDGAALAVTDSFLGATRSRSDPPIRTASDALPTLWYRFTPQSLPIAAQVFTEGRSRIYSGTDPAFLVEQVASPNQLRYLDEPRSTFVPLGSARQFFVALSGGTNAVDLRIRIIQPGTKSPINADNSVIFLSNDEPVEEAYGFRQSSSGNAPAVWFSWQAPEDGRMAWDSSAWEAEAYLGQSYADKSKIEKAPFHEVIAGERWWFHTDDSPARGDNAEASPVVSLRVRFKPKGQVAGDDARAPVDLGSQFPVRGYGDLSGCEGTAAEHALLGVTQFPVMWFRWTAPEGAKLVNVGSDHGWAIFPDAPEGEQLERRSVGEFTYVSVVPDRSYFVAFYGRGVGGYLDLGPIIVEKAANDDFAGAEVLEGENATSPVSLGNDLALHSLSAESDEPLADPAFAAGDRSAWWKWKAPRDGVFTVSSPSESVRLTHIDSASQRVFRVGVYEGETVSTLTRVGGIRAQLRTPASRSHNHGQRVTFRASGGETYCFQAASPDVLGGISVSVSPGDAYDEWAMSFPKLNPDDANPNSSLERDGLSNLLKFCLGLDPTLPLSAAGNQEHVPVTTFAENGETVHYTFWSNRFNTQPFWPHENGSPGPCDTARVVAESSTDLVTWTSIEDAELIADNRWRITTTSEVSPRFIRLKAEWCPPLWTP